MSCYVSANWNKMLLNKVFWKIYAIRITKLLKPENSTIPEYS